MRLLLIRHAEPDYARDSLTEKGLREAELLSRRLCALDIAAFFVSPMGRARDTAAFTLAKLGRQAEVLPWLEEFRGRCFDPYAQRRRIPWDYRPREWRGHAALYQPEGWLADPLLSQSSTVQQVWQETAEGVDALLARYGLHRDGPVYRCQENPPITLALFCHFAISVAILGYLTGLPPMPLWHAFTLPPSSVTTLVTQERLRGEADFRCAGLGDVSHLLCAGEAPSTFGLYPERYTGADSTCPTMQNPPGR